MLKSRAFVKRTRKGNVIKVIKEHCKIFNYIILLTYILY